MSDQPTSDPASAFGSPDHIQAQVPPAVYCNRTFTTVYPDVTRIAFAEWAAALTPAVYRVAVMMPTSEAVALAHLILRLAAENEVLKQQSKASLTEHQA